MVDVDHAGGDLRGHPLAALDVLREHRAAQAERRVVGQPDGLVLVFHLEDHRHRAEELVVVDRVSGLHPGEQHRSHEGPLPGHLGPDHGGRGAVGHGFIDPAAHVVGRLLRRQRGQRGGRFHRIARLQLCHPFGVAPDELVMNRFMHDDALG